MGKEIHPKQSYEIRKRPGDLDEAGETVGSAWQINAVQI